MRVAYILLIIFLTSCVEADDEFLIIWTPKVFHNRKNFIINIWPVKVTKSTKISVKFSKSYGLFPCHPDQLIQINLNPKKSSIQQKNLKLVVTLYRNETSSSGYCDKCLTKIIDNIKKEDKNIFIFIQTDKPIYKPGDEVKFRVLVVDRDLKPYLINNIYVKITDPLNQLIYEFKDLNDMNVGVFIEKFSLSPNTALGNWKIEVVVDKNVKREKSKTFIVQKFALPPFAAHITTKYKAISTKTSAIDLFFYAKYSFGDFVRGNAKLSIRCLTDGFEDFVKNFTDVIGSTSFKHDLEGYFTNTTKTKIDFEAEIVFEEPESGISANKTTKFSVFSEQTLKLQVIHPDNFIPGFPFELKVFVYSWDEKLIQNSFENVYINYKNHLQDGGKFNHYTKKSLNQGVASSEYIIPNNTGNFTIEVFYTTLKYRKEIRKGSVAVDVNKIIVDYLPKRLKLGMEFDLIIASDCKLDRIIVLVMSRNGNIESHNIYCNLQHNCDIRLTVNKDMLPEAKVMVYFVKNKQNFYQGETTVKIDDISENMLEIKLLSSSETKKKVEMVITTKPDSTVYLLAFDKRLTYLAQGNDINKQDVVSQITDFDGTNQITIMDMTDWHDCTNEEIQLIKKGKQKTVKHTDNIFIAYEDDLDAFDEDESDEDDDSEIYEAFDNEAEDLREDFPETWLFEHFEASEDLTIKDFKTPDSITSWIISAFSVNRDYGVAIAPPTELIVKKQFFIQTILPYSIHYNEIVEIKILVHNLVESQNEVNVSVFLFSRGCDVYDGCTPSITNNSRPSQNITLKYGSVKKVSFYLKPKTTNQDFVKFLVKAIVINSHNELKDRVYEKLKIEPLGVKTYEIISKNFNMQKDSPNNVDSHFNYSIANYDAKLTQMHLQISEGLMSDASHEQSRFEFFAAESLIQQTTKLKGSVEYFRYLKLKDVNPPKERFNIFYQSLRNPKSNKWNYINKTGFKAYFIETIASGIEAGVIPSNTKFIQNELDALSALQTENGTFKHFGNFPQFFGSSESKLYFETAFMLIPYLKFKKYFNISYDEVISKGFGHLNSTSNQSVANKIGLSVAALAYALNDDFAEARDLLSQVEGAIVHINDDQKCCKISINQAECDLMHTSYTIIAYLMLNETEKAKPLINWMLVTLDINKYYLNAHHYAIATEAIAKYASTLPARETNLKLKVSNYDKTVEITDKNVHESIEIELPYNSSAVSIKVLGVGFCSVTTIIQRTIQSNQPSSKFNLTVTPLAGSSEKFKIVEVCATYHPKDDDPYLQTLFDVIYDINMPSGYIYSDIINLEENFEIKLVEPKQKSSRIFIYYNDFIANINYCVQIKATKIMDVKGLQSAGVRVYDYNDKGNAAIEFYNFLFDQC